MAAGKQTTLVDGGSGAGKRLLSWKRAAGELDPPPPGRVKFSQANALLGAHLQMLTLCRDPPPKKHNKNTTKTRHEAHPESHGTGEGTVLLSVGLGFDQWWAHGLAWGVTGRRNRISELRAKCMCVPKAHVLPSTSESSKPVALPIALCRRRGDLLGFFCWYLKNSAFCPQNKGACKKKKLGIAHANALR